MLQAASFWDVDNFYQIRMYFYCLSINIYLYLLCHLKHLIMKSRTNLVLKILYILSWIIFVGVCIEAGGSIFSAFYTLVINMQEHFGWGMIYRAFIHTEEYIFLQRHC